MSGTARQLDEVRREALAAAARFRPPLSGRAWAGTVGGWSGAGAGGSTDFQEDRPYQPGDDPRHLHWAAFARTDQLLLKVFRAEVSPRVELLLDGSASMVWLESKRRRLAALACFVTEAVARAGASCRARLAVGGRVRLLDTAELRAGRWLPPVETDGAGGLGAGGTGTSSSGLAGGSVAGVRGIAVATAANLPPGPVEWLPGALRVVVTDLLYPTEPEPWLAALAAGAARAVVLAPSDPAETQFAERGNVELEDCETGRRRTQRIPAELAQRWAEAYARHFTVWRMAARRRGVALAVVPGEGTLASALAVEAWPRGAVEPVR